MALIRNAAAGRVARDAVVLDLGDLRRCGRELIERADAEAARILEEARAERERILAGALEKGLEEGREGIEQGRAEGRAEALEASRAELQALITRWGEQLDAFAARRDALVDDGEQSLLRLAVEIGTRLTRRVFEEEPGRVRDQAREAMHLVLASSRVTIAARPADAALLREAIPELDEALSAGAHAEIVEDDALEPGSCVVRTDHGEIDARVSTQIDRVVSALLHSDTTGFEPEPDGARETNDAKETPEAHEHADITAEQDEGDAQSEEPQA